VNVIGVAALAPASDLLGLVDNLATITGGTIFAAYVVDGYTKTYPDVKIDDYIRGSARTLITEAATRCLGKSTLVSVIAGLPLDQPAFNRDPGTGAFGQRLAENIPRGLIEAPLFIGQGETDPLVLPQVQRAFARQQCAAGQELEFRSYPGRDHVAVVAADSPLVPDLLAWTDDRLAGAPATNSCPHL
jgi:acetyl esterase/lipase